MGTGPNSSGLKGQWGVSDPQADAAADAGSDRQAQAFQAAFQAEQGVANEHLQYTAANAEVSAHEALATRRDAMYGAFQQALGKIDRNDPAKGQGEIDRVLADARALSADAATLHQETLQAKAEWETREAPCDEAVRKVEELEAWEDAKAAALRGQADAIRTQTNERRWREACTALDALLTALGPVYEPNLYPLKIHTYRAQITVTATTRDFAKIGPLMELGAESGVTEMASNFRRSDIPELKKKVRDMALAAAKEKAQQTASALGIEVGRVVAVSESAGGSMWNREYFPQNAATMSNASGPSLGGTLQPLSLEVSIGYQLGPKG